MTTWIVQTDIDNGQQFRNRFEGDSKRLVGLLSDYRTVTAKSRAHDFAGRILTEGFKSYGKVVSTYYPPHRIREVNIYAKEE